MADRGRKYVVSAFVVVAVACEPAQGAGDIVRDGGLFGDDEFLGHGEQEIEEGRRRDSGSSLREAQNDKCNRNVKQETVAREGRVRLETSARY